MAVVSDELVLLIRSDVTQAIAGLGAVDAKMKTMATTAATLSTVGMSLTKFVTAPIVGIGVASVKAWADFDQAMTESVAIMEGMTPKLRGEMEGVARDIAKTTTFSASEAAEAYFFLASAGMDAAASMAAMPQVAKFAQAGAFDMALATDLATDSLSAMGLAVDDPAQNLENLTRVTDVFTKANVLANTSVQQVAEAMTNKAGAALRAVGKDIEEGTAVLAAFADQGLKGASAGTALHIVMRDLQTASLKNADAFEAAGVAVYDSAGEMRHMSDIVGDLEGLLEGMSDKQKKATLAQMGFTDKSMGFIQTLLGTSDAIREYDEELRNASGYTDQVAANQLESFSNQWNLLKSKIADVGLTIGSILVPKLVELMDQVDPIVDKFAEWMEVNGEMAIKFAGIAAAVGPAVVILAKVLTIITKLNPWMLAISAAIAGVVYFAERMGITWGDVVEAAQPLLDIISTLADYFITTVQSGDHLNDFLSDLPEPIAAIAEMLGEAYVQVEKFFRGLFEGGEFVTGVRDKLTSLAEEVMPMITSAVEIVRQVWEDVWGWAGPFIADFVEQVQVWVGTLVAWFQENWPLIKDTIMTVLDIIMKVWNAVWPALQKALEVVWNAIKGIVTAAINIVLGIIQTVMAIITGDWGAAWDGIKMVLGGAWDAIKTVISTALGVIELAITTVLGTIKAVWEVGWGFLGEAVEGVWEIIKGVVSGGVNAVLGFINGLVSGAMTVINGLISAANKLPGIDIQPFNVPGLANGGTITHEGLVQVGERGPELLRLPAGASVTPLNGSTASESQTIILEVDGTEMARVVLDKTGLSQTRQTRRTT